MLQRNEHQGPHPRDPRRHPASEAQRWLWHADRGGPAGAQHASAGVRLRGELDVAALRAALDELLRRHEVLRTTVAADGEAVVRPPRPCQLTVTSLARVAPAQRLATFRGVAGEHARRPFDLTADPALRASCFALGDGEHGLVLTVHAAAADRAALGTLCGELSALYAAFRAGEPSPLPPPTVQYADVARWEQRRLQGDVEMEMAHWRRRLDGASPRLDLPADRPHPMRPNQRSGRVPITLGQDVADGLGRLAAAEDVSLYATLLAGYGLLLARGAGAGEVVVGAAVTARDASQPEALVGPLANRLPVRLPLTDDPSFAELARRAGAAVEEARTHADARFERIAEELGGPSDSGVHPCYQAGFALGPDPAWQLRLPGLEVVEVLGHLDPAVLDVSLTVVPGDGPLEGELRYRLDLFDHPTIERMAGQLAVLLADAAARPDLPVSRLRLLDDAALGELAAWNRTAAPYADRACLHELVESFADAAPDRLALIAGGERLTYAELDVRANRLAHHLRDLGVGPETVVGVCTDRSAAAVVGFLGVLKAGGAYLPLDPAYPGARLAHMLSDARAAAVVTQAPLAAALPAHGGATVLLDGDRERIAARPAGRPASLTAPDGLAYLIYTSGSTGKPKGVEVAHRGACNLAAALTGAFRLGPDDRVALFSSTSFDASIWETIMALANGSCLCVVDPAGRAPAEVADELRAMGVTAATFPPSFLRAVEPARLAGIRLMVAAGEACSIDLVRAFAIGERTFVNAYGPTETTVCATFARCTASMAEAPPIGGPLPNVRVHVLDRHLAPAPVGVTGDLYVGGVGLARGYRNRAGLTAERFVPDPFGGPGARLYRTGDLARRLPDGGLRYAGRVDHQVKVRGFRVELGEIEAALAALPGVREAVAAVGERRPGEAQLVAYVVPARMGAELDERALRRDLEGSLPAHMVPSVFVVMPALPLSPNGKVDRSALPDPEDIDTVAGPFSAPQSPVEELVAAIWAEALGVGRVGREDDFFEIGGHSLVAAEVLDRVRDRLGVTLRMRALFDNPVLSEFATAVQAAS